MLYKAFFYLFFDISKSEEGPEFSFLDSLNLYKKEGKGSSFTCILHHGSKSCFLEQSTSFESINSWVLVFWPYPDSEFFLLLQLVSFPIIWGICQCILHCRVALLVSLCQNIPKSLLFHAYCSRIKPLLAILQFPWPFLSAIPWFHFITSCLRRSLSWNSVPIPYPISL